MKSGRSHGEGIAAVPDLCSPWPGDVEWAGAAGDARRADGRRPDGRGSSQRCSSCSSDMDCSVVEAVRAWPPRVPRLPPRR